jgi:hypothetical protein
LDKVHKGRGNRLNKKSTEEKVLQAVNLSPDVDALDKLVEMHPMRQVFWASIIQVSVLGFMLLSMFLIGQFV